MSLNLDSVEISIVVPLYNESESIEHLFARLTPVLVGLDLNYEIICVNDGSQDDTIKRLIELNRQDPTVKVVNLSRNFGKEIALNCGNRLCQWCCGNSDRCRLTRSTRIN